MEKRGGKTWEEESEKRKAEEGRSEKRKQEEEEEDPGAKRLKVPKHFVIPAFCGSAGWTGADPL